MSWMFLGYIREMKPAVVSSLLFFDAYEMTV